MSNTVLLVLTFIAMVLIALILLKWLLSRAVPHVIRILREHGAVDVEHAVLAADVGLAGQSVWERALKRRDYKPKALLAMIRADIVKTDDEGRVYLCEEMLAKTVWHKP